MIVTTLEVRAEEPGSGIARENFDPAVSIADDFYLHVNGDWLRRTEIPGDKSNYGSFSALQDDAEAMLLQLVTAMATREYPAGSDEQKVGDLFRSFTDTERLDQLGVAPIQPMLDRVLELESHEQLTDLLAYCGARRIGAPFALYVSPDAKQSDRYIVYVTQSGTSLPDRDYYLVDDPKFAEVREKFVAYAAHVMELAGHPDAQAAAERVLALETRLAEAQWTNVENRDPVKTYNAVSRADLVGTLSTIDGDRILNAIGLGEQQEFVVRQPSYLTAVDGILKQTDVDTWRDYFYFQVVDRFAPYLDARFDQAHFDFYDSTLSGIAEQKTREKRGIDLCNGMLGEMLGKLYVRERFSPEAKQRMSELVENLKRAFDQRIRDNEWMSDGTKIQALEKLNKMNTKIGYPDEWRDYSDLSISADDLVGNVIRYTEFEYRDDLDRLGKPVDRNEWHMTPQTVNAYYSPLMNEIVFPAAILQPPFFDMSADDAVNYGAIGAVIGHEISHGFDDKGSKYDGDGNLRNWWTTEDRQEFEARAKQLVDQYSAYSPMDGLYLNGELTLGENIGDLGGLNVAYSAYRISLGDDAAPAIEGMTGNQRFFYGWGQIWRRAYREPELRRRLLVDPHSPSQFRANGIVSNMDAFYEAFDIPAGSPMYRSPEERIRIW
ncbi:MAG: M13 family metallopeptidase [Pirellulaceae bacterium]